MRHLWRALALMADNTGGILDKVKAAVGRQDTDLKDNIRLGEDAADTRTMSLKRQPTTARLKAIYELFVPFGLYLCAYELAEINRWVAEDIEKHNGESFKAVKAFWTALGPLTATGKVNPSWMEAAGAMTLDGKLRFQFASENANLRNFGFDLTDEEQHKLRSAVSTSEADRAAQKFFEFSWPGSTCGGIMVPYSEWFHVNL